MRSPETRRQKLLQEEYAKKQKNADERAKRYAKAFQNFLNENRNHIQTNNANFEKNLKRMRRPTYLLSDVLNSRNGEVRHVYARDYLNQLFKNKTIHRGPHTGVPTTPNMMRNYDGVNVNKRQHRIFQTQKSLLIKVYGRDAYYDMKHVTGELKEHHIRLAHLLMTLTPRGTFADFVMKFLRVDNSRARARNLHEFTEKEVNQTIGIFKLFKQLQVESPHMYLPFIHKLRVIFFGTRYSARPRRVANVMNAYKSFYDEFKNLLNI